MSLREGGGRSQIVISSGEDIIVVWDCSEVAGLRMGIDVIDVDNDDLSQG